MVARHHEDGSTGFGHGREEPGSEEVGCLFPVLRQVAADEEKGRLLLRDGGKHSLQDLSAFGEELLSFPEVTFEGRARHAE